ncbi:MAG TPA: hypothetical protein VKU01_09705 [Bryobacteraceae bacterium]|nr:hypothetical protein [Bryobacteraceae bacterium]
MRIHNDVASSVGGVSTSRTYGSGSSQGSSKTGSSSGSYGDQIQLGAQSQLSSAALTAGENARAERVQQLRELYVAGQHSISSHELSGAIIDAHLAGG